MENKIIVMLRLTDGDDVKCPIKARDRDFRPDDIESLKIQCTRKFAGLLDDCLYLTVRSTINGKKDNWRLSSLQGVFDCVEKLL